jgi:hypothetical protein
MLNSEIDMVEEQNKQIAQEIEYHAKLINMSEVDRIKTREQLIKAVAETKAANEEKSSQI